MELLNRLRESINVLEKSIEGALTSLDSNKKISPDVKERLTRYKTLVATQRGLTDELEVRIKNDEFDNKRHIDLINGISEMIKLDAQSIFHELSGDETSNSLSGAPKYDC